MPTERIPPREFFLRIAEQFNQEQPPQSSAFSSNWFRRKVVALRNTGELPTAETMTNLANSMRSRFNVSRAVNRVRPEMMYLFEYRAETYPNRIDYYDRYPLIIAIESDRYGFLGLNLHYLNIQRRLQLFVQLTSLLNNEKYNYRTRFDDVSYERLKPFTKYRYAKPCIKRYKYSNVRSRIIKVFAPEWEIALFLPLQRFRGRAETTVWAHSRRKLTDQ